jgi:tetratricopeptide (TPR) repeat protein
MELLQDDLLDLVARLEDCDNRLASICRQLFRAGHRELPAKLLKQSIPEKRDEEYSGVKIGIPELDDMDESQNDVTFVERLYTGWLLAERVHALYLEDRRAESVWPAELAMEPFPASWKFVLISAIQHIVKRNEVDGFLDLLGKRLEPKKEFYPDQRFLLGLYEFLFESKQKELAEKTRRLIFGSAAYDDRVKKNITTQLSIAELERGWELLKADKLEEARRIADSLLSMDLDNGQVYFFNARLIWKETKSPLAAIEKSQAYIKDLGYDPAGRGRLNNLIGCALDELGRFSEALEYFEKAANEHDSDPMYLCNMAEINEKLNRIPEALRCAREALRRKAKSEVCEKIIEQYGEKQ